MPSIALPQVRGPWAQRDATRSPKECAERPPDPPGVPGGATLTRVHPAFVDAVELHRTGHRP